FYGWFYQPNTPKHILRVFVTEQIRNEYESMLERKAPLAEHFATCFEYMQSATLLKGALHNSLTETISGKAFTYHFYKRQGETTERVLYRAEPGDIYSYPYNKIPTERVIIYGLAVHRTERIYEPTREELLQKAL